MQLILALVILFVGGVVLAGEYLGVKWYPGHQQRAAEEILKPLPYSNEALGIEIQVAAGIYEKVQSFPGGVKILRPKFWSVGPSLTITSQPNPDHTAEFSPQILAKWETQGVYAELPRFHFEHTKIMGRDAVLIRQYKSRSMLLTARVISSERIIEADCTPGQADEELLMQACDSSLRTLRIAGPEPSVTPTSGAQEIAAPWPGATPPH